MPLLTSHSHAHARHLMALPILVASAGCAELAFGQSSDGAANAGSGGSSWGLGLGATSRQPAYLGAGRDNKVIPIVSYQSRWLRIAGATAEVRLGDFALTPSQELSPGLKVRYEDSGYEAGDSPYLAGMDQRKSSLWGGLGVDWKTPVAKVGAEWVADLSGNSKGQKLQVRIDRRFQWESLGITPRIQAQWMDAKYVDYYFGVRESEVSTGRPAYVGAAAMAIEAGLRLDYQLTKHNTVFMDLGATALPDEIKKSPIVGRNNTSRVTLGYLYRF